MTVPLPLVAVLDAARIGPQDYPWLTEEKPKPDLTNPISRSRVSEKG